MSLQVWLPLNGNLNNQGLSEVVIANNRATVDSNGRIGSCYSFDGNDDYISLTSSSLNSIIKGGNFPFSITMWIYRADTTRAILFGDFNLSGSINFNLELSTSNTVRFYWGADPDLTFNNAVAITSKWSHLAVTYDGSSIKCYINGVLAQSSTTTLPFKDKTSGSYYLGRDSRTGETAFNGKMNDFRLYDHCLSAKEVKEISKGLVCHYLMNQPEQSPNLSTLPSYIPDFPSAAGTSVFSASTDGISRRLTCTTSGTGGRFNSCFSNSVRLENTTYTWSADVRASKNISVRIGLEGGGDVILNLTTDWQRLSKTAVLSTDGYSAFVIYPGVDAVAGDWIEVKHLKVEKNNFATSWSPCSSDYPKWPDNIEYDCSGYKNDGNRIGGISLSNSPTSIRYESHYSFDGDTGCIQTPNLSTLVPSGEFTMNCWVYHDDTWSSKEYETIFGGPSGFELEAKNKATNSPVLYAYSWGKVAATYELNKWNMITMTRNTSETKFYINGELKITGTAGTIPSGNYFVGAWDTSSKQNYKGKISDFRLYSTVLSAEDIRVLYNTSASIDKDGNMYAYEFKEE